MHNTLSKSQEWVDFPYAYRVFRIPPETPNPIHFDALLSIGDPPADAALESLQRSLPSCPVRTFDVILDRCEEGRATPGEEAFIEEARRVPEWVDWAKIRKGQEVFWRHTASMCVVLLYGALAGGFANPRVNDTLISTGYLADPVKVKRRIYETAQMIFDAADAEGGLRPGSEGWKSVMRVRMLHASVRLRMHRKGLRQANERAGLGDDIVPINQADMIGTALGFQCSVIIGLTRMWTRLSTEELENYTHLWRYIAYLSGVQDKHNPMAYGFPATCACLRDYLRLYFIPDHTSARLSATVLSHVTKTGPDDPTIGVPFELGVAMTRRIIGPTLADALELPQVGWKARARTIYIFFLLWLWGALACVPVLGSKLIRRRKRVLPQVLGRFTGRTRYEPPAVNPIKTDHPKAPPNPGLGSSVSWKLGSILIGVIAASAAVLSRWS